MIKNISIPFLIIHLLGAFIYMPGNLPFSGLIFQAVPSIFSSNQGLHSLVDFENQLIQELTAVDDEYVTHVNETLIVDPPGVMENDVFEVLGEEDVNSVPGNPANHGDVSLAEDGSFVYIPSQDFIGTDTFTYMLNQSVESSNAAVVEITVVDTQLPQVEWVSPVFNGEVHLVEMEELVVLEAAASDNGSVAEVQFYRWDAVLNSYVNIGFMEAAPYRAELFAGDLNREWNQVFVRAVDAAGNISERAGIWVYLIPPTYNYYFPVLSR